MISVFHPEHILGSKTGLGIFYGFNNAINTDKNIEEHKNIFNRSFDFENFNETEEFVQILIKSISLLFKALYIASFAAHLEEINEIFDSSLISKSNIFFSLID